MLKGVIIAGGKGTRLYPITKVTNKHLLPVYDQPMIYYPLHTLMAAGIKDILIISGPEHAGHFLNLLGSGRGFGVHLSYEVQEEAGGIAQALGLAEDFVGDNPVMAILGDNIFEETEELAKVAIDFEKLGCGAQIFLKEIENPQRFGVAEVREGKIIAVEEKPSHPKTNLAVTGLYIYDTRVFKIIKGLKPSQRGEYEITDVNNTYIQSGQMSYQILSGSWTDAGTFESLLRANNLIAEKRKNTLVSEA